MDKFINTKVAEVFKKYPKSISQKMMTLRQIVLDTAKETDGVKEIEETLKWGEPSYVTKNGSTVRIDWKRKKPNQYAIYFNCKTMLVETFKELYKNKFKFEGKRAILFNLDDKIPIDELKHCIALSLTYHNIKHLPMLGI
ncbi:MAG: DUF1801 domain-containing protein [Melioribacteraceae bacterium]|nr:DUF1801 domain-containing protein [Melioribacteraceae bacterium]